MKKKTRERFKYIMIIFIVISFLVSLLPMILR